VGRSHNIALSTLENFNCPATFPPRRATGENIIEPEVMVSSAGEIVIPDTPGRGYEVRTELVERLTVRKETIRAVELVASRLLTMLKTRTGRFCVASVTPRPNSAPTPAVTPWPARPRT